MSRDPFLFLEDIVSSCDKVVPDVAWREIAGMRDFVAHAYFALDFEILWSAIQSNVPELGQRVREIIAIEKG